MVSTLGLGLISIGGDALFIASIRLELSIPDASSLKEKRHHVKSLLDQLRVRFGAAVAEVMDQDLWQKAVIGVALVSGREHVVRELAQKVTAFVDSHWQGEVCAVDLEIL
jgi:uncharacterized protein YlxP (DUF503 family)